MISVQENSKSRLGNPRCGYAWGVINTCPGSSFLRRLSGRHADMCADRRTAQCGKQVMTFHAWPSKQGHDFFIVDDVASLSITARQVNRTDEDTKTYC